MNGINRRKVINEKVKSNNRFMALFFITLFFLLQPPL